MKKKLFVRHRCLHHTSTAQRRMHAQRFAKRGLPTRTAPHPAAAQSPLLRDDLQEMVPARLLLIMARVTASMAPCPALCTIVHLHPQSPNILLCHFSTRSHNLHRRPPIDPHANSMRMRICARACGCVLCAAKYFSPRHTFLQSDAKKTSCIFT